MYTDDNPVSTVKKQLLVYMVINFFNIIDWIMFMAIEDLFPVNILKMTLIKLAGMFLHFSCHIYCWIIEQLIYKTMSLESLLHS